MTGSRVKRGNLETHIKGKQYAETQGGDVHQQARERGLGHIFSSQPSEGITFVDILISDF